MKATPADLSRTLRLVAKEYRPNNGRHALLIDAAIMIDQLSAARKTMMMRLDAVIDQTERTLK